MFKIIKNEFLNEKLYHKQLDNGLNVYIAEKKDFKNSFCAFGTKFGALNLKQNFDGDEYKFHTGVAHFLEHKLFEAEESDVLNLFVNLGANVNAFTSYRNTVYYFNSITDNLKDSLELLLNFVQNLKITKESVEKEKGIITQEVLMYQNHPIQRLLTEIYSSLYHKTPLKYDIGGSIEDINVITKEELELCYKFNYHPKNMFLVVVSPFDKEDVLKIIEDNQKDKKFDSLKQIKTIFEKEESEVFRKEFSLKMPVSINKSCYGLKLSNNENDIKKCLKKELCLKFMLRHIFGKTNKEYQKWLDEGIINDFFGFEVDIAPEYAYILFYKEKGDAKELKKFIDDNFIFENFNEEKLEQFKKSYFSSCMENFNDVTSYGYSLIRTVLDGYDYLEYFDIINSISIDDIFNCYEEIDFDNYSLVTIERE